MTGSKSRSAHRMVAAGYSLALVMAMAPRLISW